MKTRYTITDGLITGIDASYTAATYIESDDTLVCLHASGAPLYKVVKGVIKERTAAELEADPLYIAWTNAPTLAALQAIDRASVRSMREYIAAQADAPQYVKDYESQAISERKKLK